MRALYKLNLVAYVYEEWKLNFRNGSFIKNTQLKIKNIVFNEDDIERAAKILEEGARAT